MIDKKGERGGLRGEMAMIVMGFVMCFEIGDCCRYYRYKKR